MSSARQGLWLAACCAAVTCGYPDPAPAKAPASSVPGLVATAVSEHCGGCHDSTRSDNRDALDVFDIRQRRWPSGLSQEAWRGFGKRLLPKLEGPSLRAAKRFVAERAGG